MLITIGEVYSSNNIKDIVQYVFEILNFQQRKLLGVRKDDKKTAPPLPRDIDKVSPRIMFHINSL